MTTPTASDRLLASFRQLVAAQFPGLAYGGAYEYAVQSVDGDGRVRLLPTSSRAIFPQLPPVTMRPSILGESVTPTIGSTCVVMFVNLDPARPFVAFGDPKVPPVAFKLAGGGAAIARVDDNVNLGTWSVTAGSGGIASIQWVSPRGDPPVTIPLTPGANLSGVISSGSLRGECG